MRTAFAPSLGSAGGHVDFFAVVEGPTALPDRGGTVPIESGDAVAAFADWHPAVRQMVAAGAVERRWCLFVAPPLRHWHRGRVVLIGDAVHAMLPHHGQDANTTIEDAITWRRCWTV
ncbi:FAD-dependent monooxygenase [Sphingomonas sp. 2378]|uniref:FAD-dependent monooxygenase n=1 Tax=Sphingomonas sp. 2378 TaxID=1219748 RepID=UPI00311B0319